MNKPIIITAALCLLFNFVYAQNMIADSTKTNAADSNAIAKFNKEIGKQSRLYNGAEYNDYALNIKSNAYFNDNAEWKKGTVIFDSYKFDNVSVKYDVYKDLLVANLFNKASKYVLYSPKVGSFDITGHHFIYISADTISNGPVPGFYEVLYNGKVRALARYSKSIQNEISSNSYETYFTKVKKVYYLQSGSEINAVNSQGDLLKLLKDHKKELQQYIKSGNIKYKKQPQDALVSIVTYYDNLKN